VQAYISYKVMSTVHLESYRSGQHEVIRRFRDFTWLKDTLRKEFSGALRMETFVSVSIVDTLCL
jgi:hypothetical protein